MKKIIRLTESDLHKIVKESVNKIMCENSDIHSFINSLEDDYHNELKNNYIAFVVIKNDTGDIVANFSKNELNDAINYAKELANENKYTSYVVCGCDENHTYSDDSESEDNSIVYSTYENDDFNLNENFNHTNYTHFAINKNTKLIVNGWNYADIEPQQLRQFKNDYFFTDLKDYGLNPKDYKILTRKSCEKQGINPDDMQSWSQDGETPCQN